MNATRPPALSHSELEHAITEWLDTWNDDPRPFIWTKTADEIFAAISRYLQRTSLPAH